MLPEMIRDKDKSSQSDRAKILTPNKPTSALPLKQVIASGLRGKSGDIGAVYMSSDAHKNVELQKGPEKPTDRKCTLQKYHLANTLI